MPGIHKRRYFPTKKIKYLFIVYAIAAGWIMYVLFVLNTLSIDSIERAMDLDAFNFVVMALLGVILYLLASLFFNMKFTLFLERMNRELTSSDWNSTHPIHFRRSSLYPWSIPHLNEMIREVAKDSIRLDKIYEETVVSLKSVSEEPEVDYSKIKGIRENLRISLNDES